MAESTDPRFFDAERAAAYDQRIRIMAPGYDDLHDAIVTLLTTFLGEAARLLVVGAGTGAEIVKMGNLHPTWRFTAVDPSGPMLEHARRAVEMAGLADRVEYACCGVEDLPPAAPHDAATSLRVAHFIQEPEARQRYFESVAGALHPGAPLILADLFLPGPVDAYERLMTVWQRSIIQAGAPAEDAAAAIERIRNTVSFLPESELEAMLKATGFGGLCRFHQFYLWGAWFSTKQAP